MRRILIIIAYALISLVVIITTILLVAYGQGYSYDFATKRFIVIGQIFVNSTPSGAKIYLDTKSLGKNTPSRLSLEPKDYQLSVQKPGYQNWKKTLTVRPAEVTFAQYIWLFPKDIKTDLVTSDKQNIVKFVPSPSNHKFAYFSTGENPGLWVLDASNRQQNKLYTPAVGESLLNVRWSNDSAKLLLETKNQSRLNWRYISLQSKNDNFDITNVFKFDFNDLQFSPFNTKQLYWISPEGLRLLDLSTRTVSSVQVDNLVTYIFAADKILYIQKTSHGNSLWSLDKAGNKQKIIQLLPDSSSYQLSYGNYNGKDLLAVGITAIPSVTLYSDIFGSNMVSKILSKTATKSIFNPKNNYITFYDDDHGGTYDIEKDQIYNFNLPSQKINNPIWLDNFHLLMNSNGCIYAAEYDGENLTKLVNSVSGFSTYPIDGKGNILVIQNLTNSSNKGLLLAHLKP